MLTIFTNPNIEGIGNLYKVYRVYLGKISVLVSPLVCVRCIGPVQILVTPPEKMGDESGEAEAPAAPVPTALLKERKLERARH